MAKTRSKAKLAKGVWTKSDLTLLKKLFANHSTAEVAERLGRPLDATKKKASRLGLRKARSYMKKLGRG
ncbi:MAG TPA: hypothetical protein ENN81_13615 [Phycisphaerales bacterium]|mgnify:CR=1 FL=1|nr:hypothetical protein [Phycisphaerales bacterium]